MSFDDDGLDDDLLDGFVDLRPEASEADSAASKKKAKPKAQTIVGLKKPTKSNKYQCRVCLLWFTIEDIALGASMDHQCKNKVDNIGRIAKSQGKTEWYQGVRANDIKLQQVVIEYNSRLGEGTKVPRILMLTYLEVVVASSAVITEEIGKIMYFRQYVAFAETFDGGKMTEVQARHQWSIWEQQIADPSSTWPPSDTKGPDGEKRIWVKTEDIMKFQSKLERRKEAQAKMSESKNASEADTQRLHKQMQLDHDFQAGRALGSLRDQAAGLMKAGGADAFSSRGIDIPNVDELGTKDEDDDEDAEGDEEKKDGDEADEEPAGKKGRWFNYDKQVPRALKGHKSAMESLKENLLWTKSQAEEALSLAEAAPPQVKKEIVSEIAALENRLDGLKIVISGTAEDLKAYIGKFSNNGAASSNAASPSKSAGGRSAIGNAAPTPTYKNLMIFDEIDLLQQEFRDASKTEDITAVNKKIADMRKPIKDLDSACRDATKELNKSRLFVMKPKGRGKGKKGKGRGKAGKGASGDAAPSAPLGSAVFEAAAEHGAEIESPECGPDVLFLEDGTTRRGLASSNLPNCRRILTALPRSRLSWTTS